MKTTRWTWAIALLVTFFISANANAQSSVSIAEQWETVAQQDEITISGREQECTIFEGQLPSNYAFLKISNSAAVAKTVKYRFGLDYVEDCSGCGEISEFVYLITVPANSSVEAACDFEKSELTRIISNPNLKGGWSFEKMDVTILMID